MSEAAAVPPDTGKTVGHALADFKDWLSPMLVKELRQGLRTRAFVMAFILMQAAIVLVMLTAASNGATGRATDPIWFVTALVLLMAMPLRGFAALSNEVRMQTMDLLTLTRLSAFKITFGKWAALYSQSLLLAVALMPYVVIRYFLGGIDLASDLLLLLFLTMLSGVLTALTVGLSAHSSVLLRGAVALLVMFLGFGMIGGVSSVVGVGGSPGFFDGFWLVVAALIGFSIFVVYYLLDMGATQFAPFAENHSTRKRLAGLLFMGVLCLVGILGRGHNISEFLFVMTVLSMAVVCVDALTERPAPVPSVYAPFVRRGALGRLFGKMFYPGWHTALWYFALVVVLLAMIAAVTDVRGFFRGDSLSFAFAALGTLLFPVVLIRLCFKRHPSPFVLYVLIQCITMALVMLVASIADGSDGLLLLLPVPFAHILILDGGHGNSGLGALLPFAVSLGYFGLLVLLSMGEHRTGRALELEAAEALGVTPAGGEAG